MKQGQTYIASKNYLDCFKGGEEYTIKRVEDCLGDLMATVTDKEDKVITWPLKQFELDIHFKLK